MRRRFSLLSHFATISVVVMATTVTILGTASAIISHFVVPLPPSMALPGLYGDVAASGIFEDFKQFADAIPRSAPGTVLAEYRGENPRSKAALAKFVDSHFTFEQPSATALPQAGLSIDEHIARLWQPLTRQSTAVPKYSSLLPLPQPYVVPGGRFRELYYWDSYFTMLGFGPEQRNVRNGMIADFSYMLRVYGHIPNGNRTYYLSRSQPPFFFEMLGLTSPGNESRAYAKYLLELKREHAYWMRDEGRVTPGHAIRNVVGMPDGSLLNRYWDDDDTPRDEQYPNDMKLAALSRETRPILFRNVRAAAESGWDFSSRWFPDGKSMAMIDTTDIVPVDLNALLYGLERAIARGCARRGDASCAARFEARAHRRRESMSKYLWNARDAIFDDYNWAMKKRSDTVSAATLYPLFVEEADPAQAHAVAGTVRSRLLAPGGLETTTNMTGQQWDAPNGWAPLQWIGVKGLLNYSETSLADDIALRWTNTVVRSYEATGKLVEKYDVVREGRGGGGEYPLQDGFGWTNGVTAALLALCPAPNEDKTGLAVARVCNTSRRAVPH